MQGPGAAPRKFSIELNLEFSADLAIERSFLKLKYGIIYFQAAQSRAFFGAQLSATKLDNRGMFASGENAAAVSGEELVSPDAVESTCVATAEVCLDEGNTDSDVAVEQ